MNDGTSTLGSDYSSAFGLFGALRYLKLQQCQAFPQSEFTLSFWVKPGRGTVICLGELDFGSEPGDNRARFFINIGDPPGQSFGGTIYAGLPNVGIQATQNVSDGKDHHIAVTWSQEKLGGESATVNIYIDGVKAAGDVIILTTGLTDRPIPVLSANGPMYVGVGMPHDTSEDSHINPENLFSGQIANLRIWSFAMDINRVNVEMNLAVTGNETSLFLAWPMDPQHYDFERNQAIDLTPAQRNGDWLSMSESANPWHAFCPGVSDYPVGAGTISLWLRCGFDSSGAYLMNYSEAEDGSGPPAFAISNPGSLTVGGISTGVGLADGKWHHVAIVLGDRAGGTQSLTVYKDGDKVFGPTSISTPELQSGQILCLGTRYIDADNQIYRGQMRDFRIWSKERGQAEIRSDVFSALRGDEAGLVVNWLMEGGLQSPNREVSSNQLSSTGAQGFLGGWVDYTGKDLSAAAGWRMSDAYLRNAVLDNANLSDQDLSGMDLTGVSLKGATLSRVNLSGATLYAAKFDGCDLTLTTFDAQPKFSRNPAFRTSFRNAKVNFSTLGKDWRYFDLSGADILGMPEDLGGLQADYVLLQKSLALKGAKLSGSSFKYADLSGAGLDGADLSEATQAGSDQTVKTDFSNANLSGAVFTQANLRGAVLFQALLRNAHFERCNLMEANLRGVFADKTDTEGAAIFLRSYMVNAVLDHGQFTEADFSEVHLYGDHASVNGASLGGAGFSKAILSSLGLARATLEAADFTGAQLINSDFTGATLKDIRFERAYLQGAKFAHTTVTRCSFAGALFGTAAGYQRVTESDSETYTVAWPAFAPSSVKFDGTCTCPDGFAGPCALAAQFTPDDRSAPFPPIPDQIPDSAHAVAPPPDFGIPGLK